MKSARIRRNGLATFRLVNRNSSPTEAKRKGPDFIGTNKERQVWRRVRDGENPGRIERSERKGKWFLKVKYISLEITSAQI